MQSADAPTRLRQSSRTCRVVEKRVFKDVSVAIDQEKGSDSKQRNNTGITLS